MNEFEIVLRNTPNYVFFNVLKVAIDQCKILFQFHKESIQKNIVKFIFLGSTSVGKSTVINALFGKNVVNNGVTEGTNCVTQCQASNNDKEYFSMENKTGILNKEFDISELDYINKQNKDLEMFPDINCLIKVYLNSFNYPILQQNIALVDCPGYDNQDLELIMNHCGNGDIFVFCFDVKCGVTPNDKKIIKKVMDKVGNCKFIILFTKCDKYEPLEQNKKNTTKEGLGEILNLNENSIFYISAEEELKGKINSEIHKNFEDFRNLLVKYSLGLKQSMRNVFLEVITSVTSIIQCMDSVTPNLPFNNIENLKKIIENAKIFNPYSFNKLDHNISSRIKLIETPYYKNDFVKAMSDYCEYANKEITKFLIEIFLINTTVNDAPNTFELFYNRFIMNDKIQKRAFSAADIGNKSKTFQRHLILYYENNKTEIYSSITKHYQDKVETFFNEWVKFRQSLEKLKLDLERMCK